MQSASSLKSHKKQKHDPKICPDCGVVVKGEKAYQVVAKREIRSNKRMTRNLTGTLKLKRSHEFITKFNSMNKK